MPAAGGSDLDITLDRPGVFSAAVSTNAVSTVVVNGTVFSAVADVTTIVQTNGAGAYRISGIDFNGLTDLNSSTIFASWSLVVVYALDSAPIRWLTVLDGLDLVTDGAPSSFTLSGFTYPASGGDVRLGVIAYEGDDQSGGDGISFAGAPLSNLANPPDNVFNSTRSTLGMPVSVVGDLPRFTGGPRSMSQIDLDVFDVSPSLSAGMSSASVEVSTTNDAFVAGTFVFSTPTIAPSFATSTKTVSDLNGDALVPGDVLRYQIVVTNSGDGTSAQTVVTDTLPMGITFLPTTIEILSGPNSGPKTEASGDDQCEYTTGTRTITCRIGAGADDTTGGQLTAGSATLRRPRTLRRSTMRARPRDPSTADVAARRTARGARLRSCSRCSSRSCVSGDAGLRSRGS